MPYSQREKQIILSSYIRNNHNAAATRRDLTRENPRMHAPCKKTIKRIFDTFQQTSSLNRKKRVVQDNEHAQLNILLSVQENPNISIRNISKNLQELHVRETSYSKVQKTLKKAGYKPFKIRPTPKLTQTQRERRVEFCRLMLETINDDPNFLGNILWTDESSFSTSGMINRKNTRYWATENPFFYREFRFQGRQSVNVWCGLIDNKIIGPYFFDQILNGDSYFNFLENQLEDFLDELPLQHFRRIIFQQDGAPPHSTLRVRNHLNQRFNIWIGSRNAPINWPANSPDLTPMDAFLWGCLKDRINQNHIENIEHLKQLIRNEINELNENRSDSIRGSLEKLRRTFIKCIEQDGGPVEQFNI